MPQRRNNRNRRRRASGTGSQSITVARTLTLGSLPAGNTAFEGSTLLAVYPDEATIGPVAQSYSEYRFSQFTVTLVPRCSTTTLGTKWCGFSYGVPTTFTDLAQVYALSRFSVSQSYGANGVTRLTNGNNRLRWFPIIPGTLTQAQLNDPTIVQAYLYAGTQGVQSGVIAADIRVTYRVTLRGPVATTSTIAPATAPLVKVSNLIAAPPGYDLTASRAITGSGAAKK